VSPAKTRPASRAVVDDGPAEPRWLTSAEMAAWLPLVHLVTLLPQRLDRQLRNDAGIGHGYYQILAMLSAAPRHELRMSELADYTAMSPSRLSHAVDALEDRGWVRRCAGRHDARVQLTRLTAAGRRELERIAPAHVAEVRQRVFDHLSREDIAHLARILPRLVDASLAT
jgi:DNA-binding MarR family transcriptional regulator